MSTKALGVRIVYLVLILGVAKCLYEVNFTHVADAILSEEDDFVMNLPLERGYSANGFAFVVEGNVSITCPGSSLEIETCLVDNCSSISGVHGPMSIFTIVDDTLFVNSTQPIFFRVKNVTDSCSVTPIEMREFYYILEPTIRGAGSHVLYEPDVLLCPNSLSVFVFGEFIGDNTRTHGVYAGSPYINDMYSECFNGTCDFDAHSLEITCTAIMDPIFVSNTLKLDTGVKIVTSGRNFSFVSTETTIKHVTTFGVAFKGANLIMPLHSIGCPTGRFPCYDIDDDIFLTNATMAISGDAIVSYRPPGVGCNESAVNVSMDANSTFSFILCNETDYIVVLVDSSITYALVPPKIIQGLSPFLYEYTWSVIRGFFFPISTKKWDVLAVNYGYNDTTEFITATSETLLLRNFSCSGQTFNFSVGPNGLSGIPKLYDYFSWTAETAYQPTLEFLVTDEFFIFNRAGNFVFNPISDAHVDMQNLFDASIDLQRNTIGNCEIVISDSTRSVSISRVETHAELLRGFVAPITVNITASLGVDFTLVFFRSEIEIARVFPAIWDISRVEVTIASPERLMVEFVLGSIFDNQGENGEIALGLVQKGYRTFIERNSVGSWKCDRVYGSSYMCSFRFVSRGSLGYIPLAMTANPVPEEKNPGKYHGMLVRGNRSFVEEKEYSRDFHGHRMQIRFDTMHDLNFAKSPNIAHDPTCANYTWRLFPLSPQFSTFLMRIDELMFHLDDFLSVSVCNHSICSDEVFISESNVMSICEEGRHCAFDVSSFGFNNTGEKILIVKYSGPQSCYRGHLQAELIIFPKIEDISIEKINLMGGDILVKGNNFGRVGVCVFKFILLNGSASDSTSTKIPVVIARPSYAHGPNWLECKVPVHPFIFKPDEYELYGPMETFKMFEEISDALGQVLEEFTLENVSTPTNIFDVRASAEIYEIQLTVLPDAEFYTMRYIADTKAEVPLYNFSYYEFNDDEIKVRGTCYSADTANNDFVLEVELDRFRMNTFIRDGSPLNELATTVKGIAPHKCQFMTSYFDRNLIHTYMEGEFDWFSQLAGDFEYAGAVWSLNLPEQKESWPYLDLTSMALFRYNPTSNLPPYGFGLEIRGTPSLEDVMFDVKGNVPVAIMRGSRFSDLSLVSFLSPSDIEKAGRPKEIVRGKWLEVRNKYFRGVEDAVINAYVSNDGDFKQYSQKSESDFPVSIGVQKKYASWMTFGTNVARGHVGLNGGVTLNATQEAGAKCSIVFPYLPFATHSLNCVNDPDMSVILAVKQEDISWHVQICNIEISDFVEVFYNRILDVFNVITSVYYYYSNSLAVDEVVRAVQLSGEDYYEFDELECLFKGSDGSFISTEPFFVNDSVIECPIPFHWDKIVFFPLATVVTVTNDRIWLVRGITAGVYVEVKFPVDLSGAYRWLSSIEPSAIQALSHRIIHMTFSGEDRFNYLTPNSTHIIGCMAITEDVLRVNNIEGYTGGDSSSDSCFVNQFIGGGVIGYFRISHFATKNKTRTSPSLRGERM